MVVFIFSILHQKHPFGEIWYKKPKMPINTHLFSFRLEIPFLTNLVQKVKIVSLS